MGTFFTASNFFLKYEFHKASAVEVSWSLADTRAFERKSSVLEEDPYKYFKRRRGNIHFSLSQFLLCLSDSFRCCLRIGSLNSRSLLAAYPTDLCVVCRRGILTSCVCVEGGQTEPHHSARRC